MSAGALTPATVRNRGGLFQVRKDKATAWQVAAGAVSNDVPAWVRAHPAYRAQRTIADGGPLGGIELLTGTDT